MAGQAFSLGSTTNWSGDKGKTYMMPVQQNQARQMLNDWLAKPKGNDVVSYTVIEPPDDRYYPGYSITQADGDVKTVGPRLKDLNIPFSLYGLPIPVTFGIRRLYGNMIWAIPLKETVKKKKKGGKGNKKKSLEYEYFATFAVAFGYPGIQESTSRKVVRVWADGSLVYDRRTTGKTQVQGFSVVFYEGSETQMPDPTIKAREGATEVPAYRGLMYMVFKDLPVGPFGDRPPAISIELADTTTPVKSVNNIYPALIDGSRSQTDGIADWSRYQYYTFGSGHVRTFDLASNVVLGAVEANPIGVGWQDNSSGGLQNVTGVQTTNETPGYLPWLGRIICSAPGTGSTPVMLLDPASGIPTHWIGADGPVTNAAYPSNEVTAQDVLDPNGTPYYRGYIPTGSYYTSQLVYNQYWIDYYIFVQSTLYNDMTILKLRGQDDILDMLTFQNGTTYDEIVTGGRYTDYSDVYFVTGLEIYRLRLLRTTARYKADNENVVIDSDIVLWKTMASGINNVYYLEYDDSVVVILDDGTFKKYSCEDDSEILSTTLSGSLPSAHHKNKLCDDYTNGSFGYDTGTDVREIDFVFGTVTTLSGQGSGYSATDRYCHSPSRSLVGIGTSGSGSNGTGQSESMNDGVCRLFYDRLGDGRIPLADFLEGISLMAGYQPSEIEISANIDDTIDGAMITNVTTFRDIMDPVSAVYRFDIIESGGKVKFVRKAPSAPATDFTIADGSTLLSSENAVESVTFNLRREEEIGVPERVSIRYLDKGLSYQYSMQFSTRSRTIETNQSNNQITYELPIVMTASEAKALSYKALWTAWNSRVSYGFRVSQRYLSIEPSDIGTVTAAGLQYTVKAVEVTYNNDFTISVKANGWLSDENVTVVADTGSGYPQTIPNDYGADAYILDLPLIVGADDLNYSGQFPVYVVMAAKFPTTTFEGGSMWAAYDGLDYEEDVSSTADTFVGVVPIAPAVPASILQTDTVNTMTVYAKAGDVALLASCTEDQLLNGENLAAYGANGRWELIQFQTVTDNGNGSYTLSNLLRGQRGTDYAVDIHKPGDSLVLILAGGTELITFPHADVQLSFRYKGVGFGEDQSIIPPKLISLQGYGALPWPPNNVRIQRDLTALTGDITISWERRSRTVGNLIDGAEYAPLESTEENSYLVSIRRWTHKNYAWSGSNWDEVTDTTDDVVTFEVTDATSLTLTAAQIRTAKLYEYPVPDTPSSFGTTFTDTAGSAIPANATANQQIVDLGYGSFVAFKSLEIMVQQKTTIPTVTSGYGSGRWTTIVIEDE
jgi:Putative phage tail protein